MTTLKLVSVGVIVMIICVHRSLSKHVEECPKGMIANETSSNCSCPDTRGYKDGYTYCFHNEILVQKGRWAYTFQDNQIDSIACPFGYCQCNQSGSDGFCLFSCTDPDQQCIENRTGILCSQCKNGTSVWMGSERCAPCENQCWILLLLFGGLSIIVIILLYFSFDAFSGYLNAFLYSYQMMPLLIPKYMERKLGISLFMIHSIGMQGSGGKVDFCLFGGIDNLDKMLINYTFAGYTLLFTFLIGILLPEKIWKILFKHLRQQSAEESIVEVRKKAFGRAISLVLVLCYSSITHITLDIFDRVDYKDTNRVYKAANIEYMTKTHKIYAVLAGFVAVFVVVGFPFALVISPILEKQFPTLYHRRAIFAALRCCFKDRSKIFAVFYFICRLVLLVVAVYIKTDITKLLVLCVCCAFFLVMFGVFQPYKEESFNFWDTLLLGNLYFMSNTSLMMHVYFALYKKNLTILTMLLTICIYVPLLTVVFRLCLYLYKRRKRIYDAWKTRIGKWVMFLVSDEYVF